MRAFVDSKISAKNDVDNAICAVIDLETACEMCIYLSCLLEFDLANCPIFKFAARLV